MKVKEIIKIIEADGWQIARQKGSHRHYKHKFKKGIVTIAGKDSMDIHPKTLVSIIKQAQIEENIK